MKFLSALLLTVALALPAWASYPLGIGLHGGFDMPVSQEGVGGGAVVGFSVRRNMVSPLHGQLLCGKTSQAIGEEDIN